MKSNNLIIVGLLVIVFLCILENKVIAQVGEYTCTISQVGGQTAEAGSFYVVLTDIECLFNQPELNRAI